MSSNTTDSHSDAYRSHRSTKEIRKNLRQQVFTALEHEQNTLIQAPTSIGKSRLMSVTAWRDHPKITGGAPVIHISPTRNARDEAVKNSKKAGIEYAVLRGRHEVCEVAGGTHDDPLPEIDGLSPSAWLDRKCDTEKVRFSWAHSHLETQIGPLPCCESEACPGVTQWDQLPQTEEEELDVDVLHVTANFAHVEDLIDGANVVFDEQPDYQLSIYQERLRRVVNKALKKEGDGYWLEGLMEAVQSQDHTEINRYRTLLNDASYSWKWEDEYIHTLVLPIVRAIINSHSVNDGCLHAGWGGRVGVVFDDENTIQSVYHRPNLSEARCVIGLDAHPSPLRWKLNTGIGFAHERTVDSPTEQAWRQSQRGLTIIQVGKSARSYTRGWRGEGAKQAKAVIRELRKRHGNDFRSCICAMEIEDDVRNMMREVGIPDPKTAHYGEIKSLNAFDDESVGLVLGCIDLGDHNIAYMLGLLGLDANPEMFETDEGKLKRTYGRGFVGPDAKAATELVRSGRAQVVAQAAGRYARDSRDPDAGATVYVMSNVLPDNMVDAIVPGIVSRSGEKKQEIEEFVQEADQPVTGKIVMEAVDCSKKHAIEVLNLMEEQGIVTVKKGKGPHPNVFEYVGGRLSPVVDLDEET